jgi:excisionase family DNA binding protein
MNNHPDNKSDKADGPRGYRINEACKRLGNVGRSTVYRWLDEGRIRAVKVGGTVLIPDSEIERVLTPAD